MSSIPSTIQEQIDQRIQSGAYASAEDVLRAAFAALSQQEALSAAPLEELEAMYPGLRQKIAEGLEDCRAGRLYDGEEFFDELDREDQERNRKTA